MHWNPINKPTIQYTCMHQIKPYATDFQLTMTECLFSQYLRMLEKLTMFFFHHNKTHIEWPKIFCNKIAFLLIYARIDSI